MSIVRVALDVPVSTLFDYLEPDTSRAGGRPETGMGNQDIGVRVRVPFGRHLVTGVIMEVTTHSAIARPKLKHITHIFRDIPPLPETLLDYSAFAVLTTIIRWAK